jgi:hypothetical protein
MYESPTSLKSGLKVMYSNGCGSVDVISIVSSVVVVVAGERIFMSENLLNSRRIAEIP